MGVEKDTKTVHVDSYPTQKFDKFVTQKEQSDAVWADDAVHFDGKFYRRTHKEVSCTFAAPDIRCPLVSTAI